MEALLLPGDNSIIEPLEDSKRASDGELVERFRNGDRDAFTMLYRADSAAVFRYSLYMTGDRAVAPER